MTTTPSITGTVTMGDGRTIQFELLPDGGYKQWGADDSRTAGETVGVVSALADGMTDMWVDLGLVGDPARTYPGTNDHPKHTECADGCGLAVTHDGACLNKPGGHQVCDHDDEDNECEGHYDDNATLLSGVGIGEPTFCDGSCKTGARR